MKLSELNGSLYPAESTFQDSPQKLFNDQVYMVAYFIAPDEPVGIGAVKPYGTYYELKRMYVQPDFQGRGVASKILQVLEEYTISKKINYLKLETGFKQSMAINFYKKMGYTSCKAFGEYVNNQINLYFEKKLF